MTTTYSSTGLEMMYVRFYAPDEMHFEQLQTLLMSMRDLIAMSTSLDVAEGYSIDFSMEYLVGAIRHAANERTLILRISYNSPLEIVIALSTGAGVVLLLASRFAAAIRDLAGAVGEVTVTQTKIMEQRNKQIAHQIIREKLESFEHDRLKVHIQPAEPAVEELISNAANALISIDSIELER